MDSVEEKGEGSRKQSRAVEEVMLNDAYWVTRNKNKESWDE